MKNPFAKKSAIYIAPKGAKISSILVTDAGPRKEIFLVLDSGEKVLVATQDQPNPPGRGRHGSSSVSV